MRKRLFMAFAAMVMVFAVRSIFADGIEDYVYDDTKKLTSFVDDAARLVQEKGEAAFPEFRIEDSKWRNGDTYIFVMDTDGNMVVYPDPALEGTNQIDMKDPSGKLIVRNLIQKATAGGSEKGGWYHYQWLQPNKLYAVWKSTYAKSVKAPSGKVYIVCSGHYNMKMEKTFVVEKVNDAVREIEKSGEEAFRLFRDPSSQYRFKDTYIFVIDEKGFDLVHPGFPVLEKRNIIGLRDLNGKLAIKEMIDAVKKDGSGWVEYVWPKPGDYAASTKSTYVASAWYGGKHYIVGCGVYLPGTEKKQPPSKETRREVTDFVRNAGLLLQKEGDAAFPEFRKPGKWLRGDLYLFVYDLDGNRLFHAIEPHTEKRNFINLKDIKNKPIVKMFIEATTDENGEGWAHYFWPKPDGMFPMWKSSFVKRVVVPSGKTYIVGAGIYNIKIDKELISAVVDKAASLIEKEGKGAFDKIRDETGPFVFLDTYVFVDTPDGVELVNPAFPSVEGKNFMKFKDASGKYIAAEYINAALKNGSAWVTYLWPKPGDTEPSLKTAYVKKVTHGNETYIVGSGAYLDQ